MQQLAEFYRHLFVYGNVSGLTIHGLSVFAGRSFFGIEWEQKKVEEIMARENLKVVSREKQLVQAQMRMLQAQIEPHFLFNTQANSQSLIARSPDKASLMMDNFIAYVRESLAASRAKEVTVQQEFTLIPEFFWQIHRGMVGNLRFVTSTRREGEGRLSVNLKGHTKTLAVSRAYQHLFKHM